MNTLGTGQNMHLLAGNQLVINQPVPANMTIESVAVQPRPDYLTQGSYGGSIHGDIGKTQGGQ